MKWRANGLLPSLKREPHSIESIPRLLLLMRVKPRISGKQSPDFDESLGKWGQPDAIDYRAWFDIRAFDIGPKIPRTLDDKDCPQIVTPDPLPDGRVISHGAGITQLAKFLPIADILASVGDTPTKFILMWGHIEYKKAYISLKLLCMRMISVSVASNNIQLQQFSYISLSDKIK